LEKGESKDAGGAINKRKAGRTASRAEPYQPRGGILEVASHCDASSSCGKGSMVLSEAAQALALGIAGEAVVGAGYASERWIVRKGSEGTARVAQVVQVHVVAAQTAQAVGISRAAGASLGTPHADRLQNIEVADLRHTPGGLAV
jgi:hypothetical protein